MAQRYLPGGSTLQCNEILLLQMLMEHTGQTLCFPLIVIDITFFYCWSILFITTCWCQTYFEHLVMFRSHKIQWQTCKSIKLLHRNILYVHITLICLLLQVSRKLLDTEESLEKAETRLASSETYVPKNSLFVGGTNHLVLLLLAVTV